ncbi:hypothetical protein [Sphingomonas oryzagri]
MKPFEPDTAAEDADASDTVARRTDQAAEDEALVFIGPRTRLPEGFDLSRFGRHARAAYLGPTADNPFLSLRSRLKRASFYDRRERLAAEAARNGENGTIAGDGASSPGRAS